MGASGERGLRLDFLIFMSVSLWVVDAFTEECFRGNPAAVCVLQSAVPEPWMQSVAAEMNLAETAFVVRRIDGNWDLRWFTPVVEVALCGHGTLAAAHVLWEMGEAMKTQCLRFHTQSGWLECEWQEGRIVMDFPSRPAEASVMPLGLDAALGESVVWCGRSSDDLLVELTDATAVRQLKPNLALLAQIPVRGVIVTAASDSSKYDFVSRFFAPALGIAEDPVTGSAHGTLGGYWGVKLGRTLLTGYQASKRGGIVGVELCGERVRLSGPAVTVWRGSLL